MAISRSSARPGVMVLVAISLVPFVPAAAPPPTALSPREKALHVLNRLAFGPRPGEVERVLHEGVAAWVDEQLEPEKIPDAAVSTDLRRFPTLEMTTAELFERFERPLREARRERKAEGSGDPAELEKARAMIPPENRPRRVIEDLSSARVLRAAESERQTNEVMVDFWMNHFNVFAAKGLDRIFVTSFERDTVRPHLWGSFEDLLLATAKSPAMLFYLDNARSVADPANRPLPASMRAGFRPFGPAAMGRPLQRPNANASAPQGLNENYARELMELHTLGVDGGYTQNDVTELARILTGWSIDPQRGEFVFRPALHDVRAKIFLGRLFPAGGGIEEGEAAIRMLARDPKTAARIAFLLCQRLVADEPPAGLVERVAGRFLATGGQLRETVRAIVTSPEFFDPRYFRSKVKSPFEYVVSVIRASGARTDGSSAVLRAIGQMGEPLYLCQPPTGYSDVSSAWINTGALMGRLNFALALAENRLPGTTVDVCGLIPADDACDPNRSVEALARALTGGELSAATRETIAKNVRERAPAAGNSRAEAPISLVAGLILGSPEFQRQ